MPGEPCLLLHRGASNEDDDRRNQHAGKAKAEDERARRSAGEPNDEAHGNGKPVAHRDEDQNGAIHHFR